MMTRSTLGAASRAVLTASILTVAACAASGEPPSAQLGAAQTAITGAERSGAVERAPVELNNARIKLERAQQAVRQERYAVAERLAREAEIDAQLASSKAQSAEAQSALGQVRQGIDTLRTETQRQPVRPAAQQ